MRTLSLVAVMALAAGPLFALEMTTDTILGTTEEAVRTSLKDLGYDVRKVEAEDGKIEAYVVKDKKMAEVYVDPATGKVVKIETK
ncbi:PepSY domain-containing protein [Ruegeria marina]|uniref:Peptidase propeptide and YPEB domain-containing protein n=1 Tax=Ruegeria marina TaxID=639004 RepID=A0A1G7BX84_9RHOB|nr:PepSY domain-containing protein [Ruegeria marina]SDE31016.1 Peptidase propeptide and YPEB domain-containing protein [Ruegeria marina]